MFDFLSVGARVSPLTLCFCLLGTRSNHCSVLRPSTLPSQLPPSRSKGKRVPDSLRRIKVWGGGAVACHSQGRTWLMRRDRQTHRDSSLFCARGSACASVAAQTGNMLHGLINTRRRFGTETKNERGWRATSGHRPPHTAHAGAAGTGGGNEEGASGGIRPAQIRCSPVQPGAPSGGTSSWLGQTTLELCPAYYCGWPMCCGGRCWWCCWWCCSCWWGCGCPALEAAAAAAEVTASTSVPSPGCPGM